jgi:AraC family transcriptional regulator of adaptative response/methylated-DNA-[protein]-cysteine methyltransferase
MMLSMSAGAELQGTRALSKPRVNDGRQAARIAGICRIIETAGRPLKLAILARHAGLSPWHFHRVFKAMTGVTPRAYAVAHRSKRIRAGLEKKSTTVTETIHAAGFTSAGRFYETSNQLLGMTPTEYRSGGSEAEIHFAVGECSLGAILVARSAKGVCAILLGDDPEVLVRDLQDRFRRAVLVGGDTGFEAVVAKAVGFVEQPWLGLDLPLDVRGTAFQQRVWEALCAIPAGSTVSYTDIAVGIGLPTGARAVARACAANALAVAIPCHRVVRTDGALSGYRWGIERKRGLLEREAKGRGEPPME